MVRTSGRARLAAMLAMSLILLAPAPAQAEPPSVSCSLDGDVLHVALIAGEGVASTSLAVLDRSGRIGVEDGLDSGNWLDCDGARVADVSTISLTGTDLQDDVWITEAGRGSVRYYPFPSSIGFNIDLGASDDVSSPDGDILTLVIRPSGGRASIGDGVFSLGAADGEYSGIEVGMIYVGRSRIGVGPSSLDASDAPASMSVFLYGGAGKDVLLGGAGNDALYGYAGADLLDGGPGADALNGGSGRDRCLNGEDVGNCELFA